MARVLALPCFCFAWQVQAQSSDESTQVPPIPIPVSLECKHLEGDEQEKCTQNTVMQFIRENLTYPQQAKELGVCGTVFVWCFVGIDGFVTDAKVTMEVYPDLDEEAVRVVKSLPQFMPAQQDGKAVETHCVWPVRFACQSSKRSSRRSSRRNRN
jgi:TonB family protein